MNHQVNTLNLAILFDEQPFDFTCDVCAVTENAHGKRQFFKTAVIPLNRHTNITNEDIQQLLTDAFDFGLSACQRDLPLTVIYTSAYAPNTEDLDVSDFKKVTFNAIPESRNIACNQLDKKLRGD
jgi:hypothetical protein